MLDAVYQAIGRADWDGARAQCRALLAADPSLAGAHHAIGLTLCGEEAFRQALPHFAAARRLDGASVRWARDHAVTLASLGEWAEAFDALTPIVDAVDTDALIVYLRAATETCRLEDALARIDARPRPDAPGFLLAYGEALVDVGRYVEADAALRRCLSLDPAQTRALDALGRAHERLNLGDRAFECWRAYAAAQPASAYAQLRIALASSDRGRCAEGRRHRERAEALGLGRHTEHDTALYIRLSDPEEDAASILAASRAAYAVPDPVRAPAAAAVAPPRAARARDGRLRVGYVSGEYRSTPAWYFFHPFLRHHDRTQVEVFLYNASPTRDHLTARYVSVGEHWREVGGLTDAALARQMAADGLDVLVDLSGHFAYNRLPLMCDRVAPAQVTYPNYPATTGCPGVEWLLTDRWTSPPGTEGEYSERLHRLEPGYLVFDLPDPLPPIVPPPALDGAPTFGVFQRLAKFNDRVWDALAAVLERVPEARLLVQNGEAELDRPESDTARRLRAALAARGVDPGRMTLRGPLTRAAHLDVVAEVDVSLDTFPYSGQTTTCESLVMGVPVVTMRGRTHVGRVSGALLARTGHADWIADSVDEYAAIAAALVGDPGVLARQRATLRADFAAAGLTDGRRLASELEAAYRSFAAAAGARGRHA
jgi:predicted O-linked N-acetylglucosamine transferase (SPINDLY family)